MFYQCTISYTILDFNAGLPQIFRNKKHQSWGDQEIEGPLPFRSLLAGTDCCIVHNDIPGIQQIEDQKKMLKKQNANR